MTTSRPAITKVAWLEVKSKFVHDIVSSIVENEIPDKLMINVDQTPSKFVPTDNVRCHHNLDGLETLNTETNPCHGTNGHLRFPTKQKGKKVVLHG